MSFCKEEVILEAVELEIVFQKLQSSCLVNLKYVNHSSVSLFHTRYENFSRSLDINLDVSHSNTCVCVCVCVCVSVCLCACTRV